MLIESTRFGNLDIAEDSMVSFPEGILGFEEHKRFAILSCEQTDPVQWLHSIDDPSVSLPIVNPFLLKSDYNIDIDDSELEPLKTTEEEDIIVYCVTVLPNELKDVTINFAAPILINYKKNIGKQVVMGVVDDKLIRYPAFELLQKYFKEVAENAGTVPQNK